jgi:hypothetical protein
MENEKSKGNMTLDKWNDKGQDEKNFANKKVKIFDLNEPSIVNQDTIQNFDDEIGKSCGNTTSSNLASSKISSTVQCPICGDNSIKEDEVNEHIDLCIWMTEQATNEK